MTHSTLEPFVNRDTELDFIKTTFSNSLKGNKPLRPQFIQFHGVGGIGKTTILKRIEHECNEKNLFPIWADASHKPAFITEEIIKLAQNFGIHFQIQGDEIDKSVEATRAILKLKGPTVFLIDALDHENEEHFRWIEELLYRFTEDSKLFFILTSKKVISFEHTMAIARKLKTIPLKPFTRNHCSGYIALLAPESTQETQNLIYKWTGGYPLAVNIMTRTIEKEQLDLNKEQDQRRILNVITEQVINRGVLANVVQDEADLRWYQTMLSLFSVPRRFNLSLMQKMMERFAEQHKLSSSLGYIDLPRRLNKKADVLAWNQDKAGFSMEAAIRPIFLTKQRIEEPQKYKLIHGYLAGFNSSLALEVTGTDKIRCLLEALYHTACGTDDTAIIETAIKNTMQIVYNEQLDSLQIFQEEYEKDEELQEELGTKKNLPLSLINKHLSKSYLEEAKTLHSEEQIGHLHTSFSHLARGPFIEAETAELLITQLIELVKQQYEGEVCHRLYEELIKEREIQTAIGPQYSTILHSLVEE